MIDILKTQTFKISGYHWDGSDSKASGQTHPQLDLYSSSVWYTMYHTYHLWISNINRRPLGNSEHKVFIQDGFLNLLLGNHRKQVGPLPNDMFLTSSMLRVMGAEAAQRVESGSSVSKFTCSRRVLVLLDSYWAVTSCSTQKSILPSYLSNLRRAGPNLEMIWAGNHLESDWGVFDMF